MVRGLVQHQQVRLLQKEFTKRHTGFLPAGESGYLLVQIPGSKTEAFEDAQHFALIGIAVLALKAVEEICVFRNGNSQGLSLQDFHLLLVFRELLLHVDQILFDRQHFFIDGALGGESLVLGEIAVAAVPLKGNGSLIGVFLTYDDPEKGGLAGAVYTDQSRLVSPFKMESDVPKDHVFGVFFTDMMTRKDHKCFLFSSYHSSGHAGIPNDIENTPISQTCEAVRAVRLF